MQHSPVSKFGFSKPVLQPQTAALPTVPVIQPKLKVGAPHDKFEQEADRMADRVMRMPDGAVTSTTPLSQRTSFIQRQTIKDPVFERSHAFRIQRLCSECDEELRRKPVPDDETVQTRKDAGRGSEVGPDVEPRINNLRTGGQPLPQSLRAFFEPRFNVDFSSVRLHTGPEASRSARDLGARAFTVGTDIILGAGEYAPGATAGRNLLAHELTHVVQQSSAPNPANVQLKEPANVRRQKIDQSCAGREGDINEGFDNARRLTSDTINKLESADSLMADGLAVSAVNPGLAETIQNAFGKLTEFDSGAHSFGEVVRSQTAASGSGRIRRLIEKYQKVADGLQDQSLNVRCDTAQVLKQLKIDEDFCEAHGAFVIPKNDQLKNDLFLCPNFLATDATPVRRGLFLLHEMSHIALGIGHEGGRFLKFNCGPLGLTFDKATKNAYAYEALAECLHREESEMTKGEELTARTPKAAPKGGAGAAIGRDRLYRLTLGVDVSPSEERVLRRFASLSLDVPLGKNELAVFSWSIGFRLLSLPGSEVKEEHIAAAMVDIGLRIQQPLRGVYLDIEGGVFAGARFEPGKDLTGTAGLGATLGAGYRFKNFEIGAEASVIDPTGDSRIIFIGRGGVRF